MTGKKWRGTALFVVILTVMGLTIGLRLYDGGGIGAASSSASAPLNASGGSSSPGVSAPASETATPVPSTPQASASATAIDGAVEQTPYGPVQVSVTFSGTRIVSVKELQSPNDERRSVEINSNAAPALAREVISSQSARIDTISGATYTSESYAKSVQSAIDKL